MFTLPNSLDGLLITDQNNIRYLTGFIALAEPHDHSAYLVIGPSSWHLVTYAMYESEAKVAQTNLPSLTVQFISQPTPLSYHLKTIIQQQGIQRLGFETTSLMWHEYEKLQQISEQLTLVPGSNWIESERIIKNEKEIALLEKACQVTDDCFRDVSQKLQAGMTETEVAWMIEAFIRTRGSDVSFPPIVAFGANSAEPHHQPNQTTLLDSDSVLFDFGAAVDGYHADLSRTVAIGEPTAVWKATYQVVQQAKHAAEIYLAETHEPLGNKADAIAREIIEHAGYSVYPHSLGHGVGLAIHENPRLSVARDDHILAGMVFTIEPAVYLAGQFGIRLEDTVLKTETELKALTTCAYFAE